MRQQPTPSRCAGLRPTLTQAWRHGLPLTPAPFQQMAQRSGSTPLELLRACEQLMQHGALQPLHARWGPRLGTQLWRVFFAAASDALEAALAALPGCLRTERAVDGPAWLWAELEVLDEASLDTQLARVPGTTQARLLVQQSTPAAGDGGPRSDPALAALLEHGLRLSTHPYAHCAKQLGRSERSVLARLMHWHQREELDGLVLTPPPARQRRPGWIVLCETPVPVDATPLVGADLVRPCLTPSRTAWPWALTLVTHGMAPPALPPGARCWPLQVSTLREQAHCFQHGP